MCANSLEAAQYLVKTASTSASLINQCNKGILIGGLKSKGTFLKRWETESIKACVSVPGADDQSIFDVGIPFKSLLKLRQGLEGEGMVYRRGEYVLLDQVECDQPAVALVDRFLSVEIEGQHHSFVQGKLLKNKTDDDGHLLMYGSSGYSLVVNNDTTPVHEQDILLPVTCILRKVIVYSNPCEPLESIVIDFQRKNLPLSCMDIAVPFYPQEGDMVWINGTDSDPWLAKIVTVDVSHQMVKVLYYNLIEELEVPGSGRLAKLYKPEVNRRLASDRVSWNAIIDLSIGEWNNTTWEI